MTLTRSLRSLANRPVLPAVVIATLAVGLGVNAAIFSLTREVILRPLPYKDADRLVQVFEFSHTFGVGPGGMAPANYFAWRDSVDAFDVTAFFRRVTFNISKEGNAVQVEGFRVSPSFFPLLGIEPARGRGFDESEGQAGHDGVVLLSDRFWRVRFNADPAIVGRAIGVNGAACTVIGVLPPAFKIFRVLNRELDLFQPLVLDRSERVQSMIVWATLKRGVSLERARAQMHAVYASLPIPGHAWDGDVALLSTRFAAQSRSILLALQWAVAVVLLIACANVANLLLAASAGRRKEMAIRRALGAGPWRIARELAGETIVLTMAGAVGAIVIAAWIVALLNANVSFQDINRLQPFRVDGWVVAFTAALTLIVSAAFGALPAATARKADVVGDLKESAFGTTTGVSNRALRQSLIIGELALAIVLSASALALTRTALALHTLARGVDVDNVMTAQVSLNDARYSDPQRLVGAASAMVRRLAAAPVIADAALVNYPPLSFIRTGVPVWVEGHPPVDAAQPWIARYWVVTPNYFRTAGIPILAGRDFTAADDLTRPGVAIVSETFAKRFWQRTDVIGHRLKPDFPESAAFWIPRSRRDVVTIVGVAGDVREDGLIDPPSVGQLYLPYAQGPTIEVSFMARTAGLPPESTVRAIREAVRAVDSEAPLSYERTFDAVVEETFARPREIAWIVGAFAVLALALASIGVYGVMAYLTAVRTQEIGIRVALGATPRHIATLVIGHATMLTAIGVGIGIVLAPIALRLIGGLLFGVGPFNPVTLITVAALLSGVSIGAAAIPAMRAARQAR